MRLALSDISNADLFLKVNSPTVIEGKHRCTLDGSYIKYSKRFKSVLKSKLESYGYSVEDYILLFFNDIDRTHEYQCLFCNSGHRILGNYSEKFRYFSRLSIHRPMHLLPYCKDCSGKWKRLQMIRTGTENHGDGVFRLGASNNVEHFYVKGLKCQGTYERDFVKGYDSTLERGPRLAYVYNKQMSTYHVDFFDKLRLLPIEVKSTFHLVNQFKRNLKKFETVFNHYDSFLLVLDKTSLFFDSFKKLSDHLTPIYEKYLNDKN